MNDPDRVNQILLDSYKDFSAFIGKRIGDRAAGEDILQLAFLKALQDPPENFEKQSVLSWFYTILRNAITDYYRSAARQEGRRSDVEIDTIVKEDQLKEAVCKCFYGVLPSMNSGYAELIRRIDLQSEDPAKVAADLDITRNNLDVRLHRARHALKKNLESLCGACSTHACLDCSCKH